MEKNIDRKTLSFGKGMTNVPSDLLSGDDELVESNGFIYRDGEMKPIQKPVKVGNIPYKIMYVHKGADYENLIAYDEASEKIYCYPKKSDGTYDEENVKSFKVGKIYDIKSIGNTLICATENGMYYILFKGGAYKGLGTELPKVSMRFCTDKVDLSHIAKRSAISASELVDYDRKVSYYRGDSGEFLKSGVYDSEASNILPREYYAFKMKTEKEKYESFQDAIQGHIGECIRLAKENKLFSYPFFVRFALELYDGTYARISNPILIYPSIRRNFRIRPCVYNKETKRYEYSCRASDFFYAEYYAATLMCRGEVENADNWLDIVKKVVIFATKEVVPFKLEAEWNFAGPDNTYNDAYSDTAYYAWKKNVYKYTLSGSDNYEASDLIYPTYKTDSEIIDELSSRTQFYKLFEVNASSYIISSRGWIYTGPCIDTNYEIPSYIKDGVVENLEEQEQLKVDDYYGWSHIVANRFFVYNNRINMFSIERKPFNGFNYFSCSSEPQTYASYEFYTHIVSGKMDAWVKSDKNTKMLNENTLNGWLYYPDPNATEMVIKRTSMYGGETTFRTYKLKAHPMLNGAYSFVGLPEEKGTFSADATTEEPVMDNNASEILDSQIFTSVVNNPFVFEASGDNTVGTGRIIDIAANTEAVSQGQFGQYPLIVFTSEGIYGLSVNSEGLYSASYPISREVCNDDSPIIPTDKLIFFASKKGLMATSGGTVACMSELMRGRIARNFSQFTGESLLKFLEGCVIAYDYRDSLLRIFKPGQTHHYIYNMVDKTFAMVNDGIDVQTAVNNYPDNLIQDKDGNVYSLAAKPDINEDENSYNGSFVTRPLKLGGSLFLKSLRAVKNLVDSDNGSVMLEIWGSNDCKHWQRLSSIGGKPWKYFTFKYHVSNFKAVDSFAGSIVEIQTRRDDKMR